jgi:diguanylate cyclase (GGDEF)-like protein
VTFPGFDVVSELGRGAETVVYRVSRGGQEFALKLVTARGPDRRLTLNAVRREATLLGCVDHPLLQRIIEVGEIEAGPYLVLEYIDGMALAETMRTGPLDEARVLRLAIDVVGALAAAHRAGVVHRDIKPDNVIVGTDGTGRLIDFGLATRGGLREDRVAGTLLYCAPEQTGMLKRPVDGRSDLYALGVVLFEAVTGRMPYHSLDAGELIHQHATAPIPDPRMIRPTVSPTLAAIIGKLMAKDPDDRYQAGESLLVDLQRLSARPSATFDVGAQAVGVRRDGPDRLVGRGAEMVALASRWLDARDGNGGCVLVQGPAGVGKSRLVRELTAAVAADGDLLLYGKCVPDDPVPLAPLRGAVERYLRSVERLPAAEREAAVERVRRAAGRGGPLLRALSPMLAALVQARDLGEKDRHEQFTNAVAAFLVDLADVSDGAVLHLDDIQWLDGPTRRVLQQVASQLSAAPLLVIGTARDGEEDQPAVAQFTADLGRALDTRLPLGPLDEDAVAGLIDLHLGAVHLGESMTDELVARVGGNPFTVLEYVRAVVDAGLITPVWGHWRLDLVGLDRLELTGDALELVLQRIGQLGPTSFRLLAAGAATGRRFPADLVAHVCNVDPKQSQLALAEAEARRLITVSGGGSYRFLHDRVREALLGRLDAGARRQLHQRIAEVLEGIVDAEPQVSYATARHYALGEAKRTPQKVYASGLAAGKLALADHAPEEARRFLEVAAAAAAHAGLVPSADLHLALGISCRRTGRFTEAVEHLERALDTEPDRLRRAAVQEQIAWVYLSAWDPGRAIDAVKAGLAELRCPLPRRRFALLASTLASFLAGLFITVTRMRLGTAHGAQRERLKLQAVFYDIGGYASTLRMDVRMRAVMSFRALYVIKRLGPSTQYCRHMAGYGIVASMLRRNKLAGKLFSHAAKIAAELGDPVTIAHVEWRRGAGMQVGGADDGQTWARCISEHERWLELGDYLTGVSGECVRQVQGGNTLEAERWFALGKARLAAGAEAEGAGFGAVAAVIPAQFGRADEAKAALDALSGYLMLNPENRTQRINLFGARMIALVERGDLGVAFEHTVAEFSRLGLKPRDLLPMQRVYFMFQAYGRLALCHQAGREHRSELIRDAEQAVEQLGEAGTTRLLRAHHLVTRADLALLDGAPERALHDAVAAELETLRLDAPLIEYEAARVRARALRALGKPEQSMLQARYALALARRQRWPHRAAWIQEEFEVAEPRPERPEPPVVQDPRISSDHLNRRRLAALQQVSLVAATVLDPRELARVALDETVRILGAERAFLFLIDADLGQLVPHLGRDGQGNDIEDLTGYSTTLVDLVRRTGEAVVVTGSEEGVALGSRSVQTHGLRSILIAPLIFDNRLLGIVYLDSRVAKGMFTPEDVDILRAITNHVAMSLETAHAAQLALAIQSARRQLEVAETLRAAMAEQSATLDPDEVMRRLLRSLAETLCGDAAALLTRQGDALVVTASHGHVVAVGATLDPAPQFLLELKAPVAGGPPAPFGELLGPPRNWLAIPVTERAGPLGVLVVGSEREELMQEEQVKVAAALAGQGMTAYENARLFSEVQRLATIDGLTGLYNRAHFSAEASRLSRITQRYKRPFAAIMLDVDHFKRINDTYGHPVGDDVIQVVAARLREAARDSDLVGRYGGEEFALVTPETGASALRLAERLHRVVSDQPVITRAGPVSVTISVGLAYADSGAEELGLLLARADAAMYEAKQAGRNRVVTAEPAA